MGADILPARNHQYSDHKLSLNQSQYRISLASPYNSLNQSQFVNYMSKDFSFTQETMSVLSRQQIVENNFSQEFDPLFTTFKPQNKNSYGKFRILCSNITNEKIQEYRMFFRNEKEFRTYLVSYFWRKNHSEVKNWPLVRTTNLRVYDQSKRMLQGGISGLIRSKCSSSKEIYCKIYVEDIPLRLCHIKDIPYPQNLYVMSQVLKGFQIIYQNIGYIKPFEDLICITRKGVIKVWINSDLSKNFPNIQNIDQNLTSAKSQSKLVNQLIDIVVNNTDPTGELISFYAFLRQQHVNLEFISFEKALEMISKYQHQYNVQIPDVFSSIVEVLNQEEEEYDTYRTDMEHANEEKGESSQPIRSQNRSGSGLFLDVPGSSSRLKINNNKKSRISSKKQSSRKLQQKHKNKTQKTQSLKIDQQERNSLQQSISGAKSNIMLSQSLPISRSINQQQSSNQINGKSRQSRTSHKEISRSRLEQSDRSLQKHNEGNFVQIEREKERSSKKSNESSVMAMRESQEGRKNGRSYMEGIGEGMGTEQMLGMGGSKRAVGQQNEGYEVLSSNRNVINSLQRQQNHNQLPNQIPYTSQHSLKNFSINHFTQTVVQNPDSWFKIHSNNQLPINNSHHPSQFMKNKKTYSNLYRDRKYSDRVLLNEQEDIIEPSDSNTMVIKVEATEEEMRQMIEIDRFIEAQVLKEEEERLRLSEEMYPSKNHLQNKNQQLMNSSHHLAHTTQQIVKSPLNKSQQIPFSINKQLNQPLNQTTIPLPPALNQQSSSHISSKPQLPQQQSMNHMLTSRQKQLSKQLGVYNEMHLSHHVAHLDHRVRDQMGLSSYIVQRSVLANRQGFYGDRDSGGTKVVQLNELMTGNDKQRMQAVLSPHSKSSINSHPNHHLSFQHSNLHIEIQSPSSSSRANPTSQNTLLTNLNNNNPKVTQKNLPPMIVSTLSNQFFIPLSQHQLMASIGRRQQQTSPALISSTSIGKSIVGPRVKQVNFQLNSNTIVSSPLQSQAYRVPKVTFTTKSPQKISYSHNNSSKNVSLNQINYSQKQIIKNSPSLPGVLPLALSNPGQTPSNKHFNRLSYGAQTMVSAYMYSQGGGTSSRKYCDHEESSEYSKPSIVEYSYLRNPEYFGNVHNGVSHAEHQTSQAFKSPMESYLQKVPSFPSQQIQNDLTPSKDDRLFSHPQINHHYSYHPVPFQPHMLDIIPIPQQTQGQIFNNSRSLVNNDEYAGGHSYGKNYFKEINDNSELVDQIVMVSSRREVSSRSPHHHYQRQTSGINLGDSQKDQGQNENQHHQRSQHRKQSYFISQQFSHSPQEPIKSQQSNNFNQQFKINIRPSFESMSGCSQMENQPFSNKSYIGHSRNYKQNKSSFLSGKQKENDYRLVVEQRASDQGSNKEPAKSGYRVVESIEENRPNSTYQMDLETMEKQEDQVLNMEECSSLKLKGYNNLDKRQNANLLTNNQNKSQQENPTYQKASHSPRDSQKPSPRAPRIYKPPVTGRTMFMNKENELLSQFIDQESQLESQVDYTYNSYDKWKDKSKVLDFGPSRFKEFDEKVEEEGESNNRKLNHVGFGGYPERHWNHKQLVKSSIEGTKLLSHEFSRRDHFNTVQKQPNCNEAHQGNDQSDNQLFLDTFSPNHRMEINRIRATSEYKEEEIDEDILNDLREY